MPEYISYFPIPFLEDLVQGRCLPFVGAGFSLNAKIPNGKIMLDWDGLGKKAALSLPEYQYTTAIEALSAYAHEFSRVKLVEFLSSALLVTSIQPAKTHEHFCRLPFERVVTTNFDFLLEHTYTAISKYCIPLISEEQLSVGNSQAGVRLLKIHGDLHHPNRLVVTEEDYDSFLASYPLLATHLSSLLIDHTAFFVGYSLDDPDFRQIWQVVKERLGELRRPGYVLQVGAPPHVVARYERRGVKVINLPKSTSRSYTETLNIVFQELLEYWSSKIITLSTATEAEPQAELSLPSVARGRLAFFSVPTRYAAFYKSLVYPIAEKYGFSPIMAVDVIAPGDTITAKVYALIEKAAIVVADLSSPNTLSEVGMVLSKEKKTKPLILIAEDLASFPIDVSNHLIIRRPHSFDENIDVFLSSLEKTFSSISSDITPALEEEPARLITKREYRAAVIAVFTLLEHELRQLLESSGKEQFSNRFSILQLIQHAVASELIDESDYKEIRMYMNVRNKLVHTRADVPANEAKKIVKDISRLAVRVREKNQTIRSTSNRPTISME
ncbi:MAG: SIR2 family NAD-dependent protein deacylase [Desulfobulbaceae bacterium]